MKKTMLLVALSFLSANAFADTTLNCESYAVISGKRVNMTIQFNQTGGALKVNSSPISLMETGMIPKTGEKATLSIQILPERIFLTGQDRYNVAGNKLVNLPLNSNAAPTIHIRNRSFIVNIATTELSKNSGINVMVQTSQESYKGTSDPYSDMQFTCSK